MRTISSLTISVIVLRIGCQLNALQTPIVFSIANGSDYFERHYFVTSSFINSLNTNVHSNGKFCLDVHDKTRRVTVGSVEAVPYKADCDIIKNHQQNI